MKFYSIQVTTKDLKLHIERVIWTILHAIRFIQNKYNKVKIREQIFHHISAM